jgi:hypothetical protein
MRAVGPPAPGATSASAIAALLTNRPADAAPAGLTNVIISFAVNGSAPAAVAALAKGALLAIRFAQLKLALLVIAACLAIGSAAIGVAVVSNSDSSGPQSPQAPVAPVVVDRSTPSRALRTLMNQMLAGTDKGDGWIADTDTERLAGEMISDMYYEAGQLRAAAEQAFKRSVQTPMALQLPSPEQLEGASEVFPGGQTEIAYVIDGAGRSLLPMHKTEDEWKLSVADWRSTSSSMQNPWPRRAGEVRVVQVARGARARRRVRVGRGPAGGDRRGKRSTVSAATFLSPHRASRN